MDKIYDVPKQHPATASHSAELETFADVIQLKEAEELPLHCMSNKHFPMINDKTTSFGPLYAMPREELKTLMQWRTGKLRKGFTLPSFSPVASSVLFAKKKYRSPAFVSITASSLNLQRKTFIHCY